jgi:hypothetical protein
MVRLIKSIYTGNTVTSLGETTSTDQLEGRFAVEIGTLTDAATITVDFGSYQNFEVTLAGNRTLGNPSGQVEGQVGSVFIAQDGTGSRTLSFSSDWNFPGGTAPTLTTTASAVDRLDYIVYSANSVHAVVSLNVS